MSEKAREIVKLQSGFIPPPCKVSFTTPSQYKKLTRSNKRTLTAHKHITCSEVQSLTLFLNNSNLQLPKELKWMNQKLVYSRSLTHTKFKVNLRDCSQIPAFVLLLLFILLLVSPQNYLPRGFFFFILLFFNHSRNEPWIIKTTAFTTAVLFTPLEYCSTTRLIPKPLPATNFFSMPHPSL